MRQCIAFVLVVSACLGAVVSARAQSLRPATASASCAGAKSWQTARRQVGHVATIKGPVVGTKYASTSSGSPTFLDVGAPYPSTARFTVVIWVENRSRFGAPESRYRGKTICVRGYVSSYHGVAEIEATSPTQISVTR